MKNRPKKQCPARTNTCRHGRSAMFCCACRYGDRKETNGPIRDSVTEFKRKDGYKLAYGFGMKNENK